MTRSIYLDHAATSWPKPLEVVQTIQSYWASESATIGRSFSNDDQRWQLELKQLRQQLAQIWNTEATQLIFTTSATDGLNLIIHGYLLAAMRTEQRPQSGKCQWPLKVMVSSAEHNSVLRPLNYWQQAGKLELTVVEADPNGQVTLEAIQFACKEKAPDLLCLTHASNVTGMINPVHAVSQWCRQNGTFFLLDAAQTTGTIPIDLQAIPCHAMVTAGHKGLRGPLGTGVVYVAPDVSSELDSIRLGGTGTQSFDPHPVTQLPFKWEAGNPNVPGLLGLAAAIKSNQPASSSVLDVQHPARRAAATLWDGIGQIPDLQRVADPGHNPFRSDSQRLPILSCTCKTLEVSVIAAALQNAGIIVRAGFHCAPLIHSALSSADGGTLRFSTGPDHSPEQMDIVLTVLKSLFQFS